MYSVLPVPPCGCSSGKIQGFPGCRGPEDGVGWRCDGFIMQKKIVVLLLGFVVALSACSSPSPPSPVEKATHAPRRTVPLPTHTSPQALPPKTSILTPTPSPTATVPSPPMPLVMSTRVSAYPTRLPVRGELKYQSTFIKTKYTRMGETLVHGEKLFFTGRVHRNAAHTLPNAIFEHDLKNGKTKLLTTSIHGEEGVVCCLDASDHWLVWLTYLEWGGLWRVCVKNLDTGKKVVLDKQEEANVKTMSRGPYAAVWGDKVVWSSPRTTKEGQLISVIMVEDLETGVKRIITSSSWPEAMGYVDIYEDEVVWSKGSRVDGKPKANVFSYNLSSDELKQVTLDDVSGQPQIWGKWLVWRQGFGDHGPIIIENRRNGRRYMLSDKGRWLRLGDGLLVFIGEDEREYVYDIERNSIQRLPFLGSSVYGRDVSFVHLEGQRMKDLMNSPAIIEVRRYER